MSGGRAPGPEGVEVATRPSGGPDLPQLTIHKPPAPEGHYVIGADPAEGNPESDDSAAVLLDIITREQMARMAERADPPRFAAHLQELSGYYNKAPPGQHDDCAVATVLALAAMKWRSLASPCESAIIPPREWLKEADEAPW